jgi:uncharacterized membrane protein
VFLIILWAIGFSMIALAGLIYLPMRALMGVSIAIIALHTVYAVWVVVLLLLYPACLWFARLKQRRHDWWLTYF